MKIRIERNEFCCLKCGSSQHPIDRHHIRHQKLILQAFQSNAARQNEKYRELKKQYAEFREEDIALLCRACHQDAHDLYFPIIHRFLLTRRKILPALTWRQANALMNKLEAAFWSWIDED